MGNFFIEQLSKKAKKEYDSGNFLEASVIFNQAFQAALENGQGLLAAEQRNNCSVALLKAENPQGALDAAAGTDQLFAEAGDLSKEGMALGNMGAALEALGRLDEAADMYERSASLFNQAGEKDLLSFVLKSLSAIQVRQGHQLEALATMQSALDSIEKPSLKEKLVKQLLKVPFRMTK